MRYSFSAWGHPNITASHKTTLEFTKDHDVTLRGDCIVGVRADFELKDLKLTGSRIKITISIDNLIEEFYVEINPTFNSNREVVIRKSDFISGRTFAIHSDKAAADLSPLVKKALRQPKQFKIILEEG